MKTSTILLIFIILISSCSKHDPSPAQVQLVNTDMEAGSTQPNSWFLGTSALDISTSWTTEASSSPTHSLKISRDTVFDANSFASWGQTYQGVIPVGRDLLFSVKIKGNNIQGQGVSIAIRCDGATTPDLQFSTTAGSTSIRGTFDWTTYNVKLSNVGSTTRYIIVYLVYLPTTTGTVYFDDALLQHY